MKTSMAIAITLILVAGAGATETTRYTALVNGGNDKAGHQWVMRDGDHFTIDYLYKNNGRGPELKEEFTLDQEGTLARYSVKGVSTYGALVDETFTRRGDTAVWKTAADKGEQTVTGAALYWPVQGTPATFSVAFEALSKRSDGKIPMIPSGALSWR